MRSDDQSVTAADPGQGSAVFAVNHSVPSATACGQVGQPGSSAACAVQGGAAGATDSVQRSMDSADGQWADEGDQLSAGLRSLVAWPKRALDRFLVHMIVRTPRSLANVSGCVSS